MKFSSHRPSSLQCILLINVTHLNDDLAWARATFNMTDFSRGTPSSREHCSRLQQLRYHAVIIIIY